MKPILLLALLIAKPVRADLIAYWPFNVGSSLTTDPVGGNVLTVNGDAAHTSGGKFGGGLQLDGTGDFLSGTVSNLPIGDSAYTLSAWVKTNAGAEQGIIGWGNYGTTSQVNAFRTYGDGLLNYWWGNDLGTPALGAKDGNWHHVAATYDGATRRIYLDGIEKGSDTPGAPNFTADNFRIGSTNFAEFFDGILDDVAIFDHALTPAEISGIHSRAAALYTIVTHTNDSGVGSLRQALADSVSGGTIIFHASLSGQTIILGGSQLLVDKDLTIDASTLPGGLTIDAAGNSRILNVPADATLALHGLNLVNGKAPDGVDYTAITEGTPGEDGGGILSAGTLTLLHCTLSNNVSGNGGNGQPFDPEGSPEPPIFGGSGGKGGGIYSSGSLTLIASTLSANQTGQDGIFALPEAEGGAIYSSGSLIANACLLLNNQATNGGGAFLVGGNAFLASCIIENNQARGGGGISCENATLTLENSLVLGNIATGRSGGISNFLSTLAVSGSTFGGNSAGGQGGAIWTFTIGTVPPLTGSATLSNCTFTENSSGGDGGAIYNQRGLMTLSRCTLSGNSSTSGLGGGINSYDNDTTETIVENSIIAGNSSSDVDYTGPTNTFTSLDRNLIGSGNATGAFTAHGDITGNTHPLLAPLGDYGGPTPTMLLLPGSPAIDAGAITAATADQRGFPIVGTPDIGATEFQPTSDINIIWPLDFDGDGSPYGVEFALGTDPFVSDPGHPANLASPIFESGGIAKLTFGRNGGVPSGVLWKLMRSTSLEEGSFVEIYRFDGTNDTKAQNILSVAGPDQFTIFDQNPPSPKAFYRFEAVYLP